MSRDIKASLLQKNNRLQAQGQPGDNHQTTHPGRAQKTNPRRDKEDLSRHPGRPFGTWHQDGTRRAVRFHEKAQAIGQKDQKTPHHNRFKTRFLQIAESHKRAHPYTRRAGLRGRHNIHQDPKRPCLSGFGYRPLFKENNGI